MPITESGKIIHMPTDKRKSGRTKQLSLKSKQEFHQELKRLASEQNCLMIEVLERAFADYKEKVERQKPQLKRRPEDELDEPSESKKRKPNDKVKEGKRGK
ncbi:MAG: hypothetical protein NY202_01040 [Mollicutes bacterium UO1]